MTVSASQNKQGITLTIGWQDSLRDLLRKQSVDAVSRPVEKLLCLIALFGKLDGIETLDQANEYYENSLHSDCDQCPATAQCVVCKFYE